jgi:hypothetical protein
MPEKEACLKSGIVLPGPDTHQSKDRAYVFHHPAPFQRRELRLELNAPAPRPKAIGNTRKDSDYSSLQFQALCPPNSNEYKL